MNNASLMINIAATVIVARLLKPEIPSSGEIKPVTRRIDIITTAITSTDSFSVVNQNYRGNRNYKYNKYFRCHLSNIKSRRN